MPALKTQKLTGSFLGRELKFEVLKDLLSLRDLMTAGVEFSKSTFDLGGFSFLSHELKVDTTRLVTSLEFCEPSLLTGPVKKTTYATWSKKLVLGPFKSEFQKSVLLGLLKSTHKPLKSLDYSSLAEKSGHAGAARAAASVMAQNPWPVIFPCHRVLPKGKKSIGAYGGGRIANGSQVKEALLLKDGLI